MFQQPVNEIIELDADDEILGEMDDDTELMAETIEIVVRQSDHGEKLIRDAIEAYKKRLGMLQKFSIPRKLNTKIFVFKSNQKCHRPQEGR